MTHEEKMLACCGAFKHEFGMTDVACCDACYFDTDHDFDRNTQDIFAGGYYWSVCHGIADEFFKRYPDGV